MVLNACATAQPEEMIDAYFWGETNHQADWVKAMCFWIYESILSGCTGAAFGEGSGGDTSRWDPVPWCARGGVVVGLSLH